MDTFEEDLDNPFTEIEPTSETSSTSKVNISEPPSPLPAAARQLSPTAAQFNRPFPSPGSQRQSQPYSKVDFCCARDRVLHSDEEVEILVSEMMTFHPSDLSKDHRRRKDIRKLEFTLYYLRYSHRG
jgi:sorting nexin-41/42